MSSFTLYDASIGVAKDVLNSLANILKKAESHANASSLPTARLYEDMLPLSFQVHMVTDTAQKMVARTTGVEPLDLDRNMETLEAMQKRIAQVQEIVEKADKETINSRAGETVTLGLGPGKTAQLKSIEYVQGYGVPNLYFHLSTAYAILRNQGVPLGKTDYLGSFLGKFVSN